MTRNAAADQDWRLYCHRRLIAEQGWAAIFVAAATYEVVRGCGDAILAEKPALNAVALRWDTT